MSGGSSRSKLSAEQQAALKHKDSYHLSTSGNARAWIVTLVVLPMSLLYVWWHKLFKSSADPSIVAHDARVARVCRDVKAWQKLESSKRKPMRTDRSGNNSHSVRTASKEDSHQVRLADMNAILGVDMDKMTVRLEPGATVGKVTAHLTKLGLQLEATLEMEEATLGGLCMATGMTTHSHQCGLTHDTAVSFDIVTASGEALHVTKDGEHADLFRALPWSHGSLGFLVAVELRVTKASKFVLIKYTPFYTQEAYSTAYKKVLTATGDASPFFLEMIIFSKDCAVLMEGKLASKEQVRKDSKKIKVNKVAAPAAEWFFKHVERVLDGGKATQEYVDMYGYLMRHDRSMCMTLGAVVPFGNQTWFRYMFGWLTPPSMALLKSSRRPQDREDNIRVEVWQDAGFPVDSFMETVEKSHQLFEIYPLLCYPCKVFDNGGMTRVKGADGARVTRGESVPFLNLGIYGRPKPVREGSLTFPTIHKVREWEKHIRNVGGFQHTYCDSFQTEEEFEEMYDHSLWKKMREAYKTGDGFKSVYAKTRPEVDIWKWLDEEKVWMAAENKLAPQIENSL